MCRVFSLCCCASRSATKIIPMPLYHLSPNKKNTPLDAHPYKNIILQARYYLPNNGVVNSAHFFFCLYKEDFLSSNMIIFYDFSVLFFCNRIHSLFKLVFFPIFQVRNFFSHELMRERKRRELTKLS